MASLKKHSHGIPPSTSLGIVSDLTQSILSNPLVDPGFNFRAGFILAGLSLVVGYQVVANG